jgi:cell division protein FtsW
MMTLLINHLKSDLRKFLLVAISLVLVGLIFVYSASSVFALEKFGNAAYFLKRQMVYIFLGVVGFVFFALVPKEFWKKHASLFFLGSVFLTLLTFVPQLGLKCHGSNRWLSIAGFSFQPSEFLKLFLLMYLGYFLEKRQLAAGSFVNSYLPYLLVLGLTSVVLLKQPDFGSMITIFATSVILLFVAEFNLLYLGVTVLLMVPAVVFLILAKSYRINRILIFLNPWADPQGKGFQIIQSLIAIGSGSALGLGISNSKQKFFYLPMQHTDFIFSIIAEETGFVGSCIIILLYFLLCFYGLRLALQLSGPFEFFTTIGFVAFISLQAVINLMVTSGLLPTKGLSLPFVSYGGTAIISLFCMLGLISNFAKNNQGES